MKDERTRGAAPPRLAGVAALAVASALLLFPGAATGQCGPACRLGISGTVFVLGSSIGYAQVTGGIESQRESILVVGASVVGTVLGAWAVDNASRRDDLTRSMLWGTAAGVAVGGVIDLVDEGDRGPRAMLIAGAVGAAVGLALEAALSDGDESPEGMAALSLGWSVGWPALRR